MRAVLTYFLHAPVVWLFVISATLLAEFIGPLQVTDATRLTIVLVGLIFIYIMYRSGDLETRRKVLWFFEMALASLIIGLLLQGVRAVLHDTGSPTLRLSIFVLLICANYLIYVICICSAVFYSGAISPALVIRKTFVYGVTTALLLFTYATVETFLVNFLVDKTGISDRFASTLLGTVLALAFHPIKNKWNTRCAASVRRRLLRPPNVKYLDRTRLLFPFERLLAILQNLYAVLGRAIAGPPNFAAILSRPWVILQNLRPVLGRLFVILRSVFPVPEKTLCDTAKPFRRSLRRLFVILRNFLGGTEKSLCDIAKPSRITGKCPLVILGNRSDTSGKHFRGYFGQAARSFAAIVFILRLRQLSSRRGSSRRFPTKRGYDVKMRMVNGLAAAESVILLHSETGCSQSIFLRDPSFLNRNEQGHASRQA